MDQGVIKNFRVSIKFRYLVGIEENQNVSTMKIIIKDAASMSAMAWNEKKSSTILNSFKMQNFEISYGRSSS